jgi:hypothetical protein
MKPEKFGRLLGTGIRVAGRVVQDRHQDAQRAVAVGQQLHAQVHQQTGTAMRTELSQGARTASHAAGRGMAGFLRPFRRIGGILWLEITGFFFGMFAVYFGADVWRMRASLHPSLHHTAEHNHLLLSAAVCLGFTYLSLTAFLRARRR